MQILAWTSYSNALVVDEAGDAYWSIRTRTNYNPAQTSSVCMRHICSINLSTVWCVSCRISTDCSRSQTSRTSLDTQARMRRVCLIGLHLQEATWYIIIIQTQMSGTVCNTMTLQLLQLAALKDRHKNTWLAYPNSRYKASFRVCCIQLLACRSTVMAACYWYGTRGLTSTGRSKLQIGNKMVMELHGLWKIRMQTGMSTS